MFDQLKRIQIYSNLFGILSPCAELDLESLQAVGFPVFAQSQTLEFNLGVACTTTDPSIGLNPQLFFLSNASTVA